MNWYSDEDKLLRRYLLDDVTAEERRLVEEKLLSAENNGAPATEDEPDFVDRLLMVEDELIDDYVCEVLLSREQEFFEQRFLSSTGQRQKLMLARQVVNYAHDTMEQDASSQAAETVVSTKTSDQASQTSQLRLGENLSRALESKTSNLWQSWFSGWKIIAYALLVVGLGMGIWRMRSGESELTQGLAALNQAYREQRPVEARISGLAYAPFTVTQGAERERVDYLARDLAASKLLGAAAERDSANALHALGKFYLSQREFEKAIDQFQSALKLDANNAQLHGDLGAALFEKGKLERLDEQSGKSETTLARSLEQFSKAIEMDGKLLDARFNRALVYQVLALPERARDEWRKYLELDASSAWAEEARHNLKRLEEQGQKIAQNKEQLYQDFLRAFQEKDDGRAWLALRRSYFRTGNYITNKLIDDALTKAIAGDTESSEQWIRHLEYAGKLSYETVNDRSIDDSARFYKSLAPGRYAAILQARQSAIRAYELFNQSKVTQAIAAYVEIRDLFRQHGDFRDALLAEYRLGYCYFQEADLERSNAVFAELVKIAGEKNYHWLQAVALHGLAATHEALGNYSKALDYCRRSRQLAERIGDDNGKLRSANLQASLYRFLGKYQDSLLVIRQGMEIVAQVSADSSQKSGLYATSAWDLGALGLYAAAQDYAREAVRIGEAMNNPLIASRNYVHEGMLCGKRKNYPAAIQSMEQGLAAASQQSDTEAGAEMRNYVLLYLGHIYRDSGELTKALAAFDSVIEFCRKRNSDHLSLYSAHKGRLLSFLAQQNKIAAWEELPTVLDLFEKHRIKIQEESNRNSFFDMEQDVYDVAMSFAYFGLHRQRMAFEYSEASRARSLLDSINAARAGLTLMTTSGKPDLKFSGASKPMNLDELQGQMAEQAQILQYAVLEDKVIIWRITKTSFESKVSDVPANRLSEKVASYLAEISRPGERTQSLTKAGEELYALLLQPVVSLLDEKKLLCIVPDKVLNLLPYEALISPRSKKYLVEEYRLVYSPSATLFTLSCQAAQSKSPLMKERLLSVGNPRFDRRAFPDLADLPLAAREAAEIAGLYDSASLLTMRAANKERLRKEMERVEVIHLALHHVTDERSPMFSKIVLAAPSNANGQPDDEGWLAAHEVYRLNLTRSRLVVLSACRTMAEGYFKGEGAIGVARPFQAAGVPMILASLWPVDSAATSGLMVNFHRFRKRENLSNAEALQAAQLAWLNQADGRFRHPYYWAAFIAVGGNS